MNQNDTDWMLNKGHHEELIRIAAQERLAREACRPESSRPDPLHTMVNGLKRFFARLGDGLRASGDPNGTACLAEPTTPYSIKEKGDAPVCC